MRALAHFHQILQMPLLLILEFSDSEVTGLKCLSGKSGSKRFLFRYVIHSRKRSLGLGRFPDIDVATARKAARGYRPMLGG